MTCADERRRGTARAKGRNGIDAVSVGEDRHELTVMFFGDAPEGLQPANFRIEGGTRITGIAVTAVTPCPTEDPELEGGVRLTVDRVGDLSTYRLCVVDVEGFDPRYRCIDFAFITGCDDIDCAPLCQCPDEISSGVEIDYLAKDYASFRQLMLERLSLSMPAWTERHIPDIGITLVELLAYEADRLSYQQDAAATEAYLDTARLRTSVRRHARLVDYPLHDGCAARAWVCVAVDGDLVLNTDAVQFSSGEQIFEPVRQEPVSLYPSHNRIGIWTWGDHDCCLPIGATAATLVDGEPGTQRTLALKPGDVLILEEVIGPKTGAAADRDVTHRQAVRLTTVVPGLDPLFDQPVMEVTWAPDDALRFPLCVNARGGPDCCDQVVGVASGNVVLVEHGGGAPDERLPVPAQDPTDPGCPDPVCFGCQDAAAPARVVHYPPIPKRFRPSISRVPVTQTSAFPPPDVAARTQAQWLRELPDRARAHVTALRAKTADQPLSQDDIDYLTTLFGRRTLDAVNLSGDPSTALGVLLVRFDELLVTKLERLDELLTRALGGCLLSADGEGWEIAQTWGVNAGDLDPGDPRFFGPATAATQTDPRDALPAITVFDRWNDDWQPRRDLLDSGPDDRHFVGETDDNGVLHLRFGDGSNGADFPLPEPDSPAADRTARAHYRIGNGTAGNVGAETINRITIADTSGAPISSVRNPIAAAGGTDPEDVAAARIRAPYEARLRQLRAITAQDYVDLAARLPGVQRAAATLAWTGSWYEAEVAIDALGTPVAPDRLLDDVRCSLHRYRKIGHDLSVSAAVLVPLALALCIEVKPDYLAGHVRAALLKTFGSGPGGYFNPDRLTFGTPIRVSSIVAAAASVPGVLSADVTALERLFGPPGDALDTGVLAIRPLEVAQLDADPTRPENGRLDLTLVGGR
ncbi:putative baseplate assembly protein [Mycobacterium sp. 852013-50091_SCH5140682]|uniref:putative baseplate assembly protein n=1 Tax=Mycobacterium sp. 852013-50091_SCH5140682 TaxID=1834109 RepID=UPI0007EBA693|nr:putative baseplate assembly protein [Mycobacterium sp. 852013-50091_SCH5140682]OBC00021.1 putative baseplate assembly protein [Mycobacterium sp. 852013-50091_SCH5140682]